jgi:hypothetical protein
MVPITALRVVLEVVEEGGEGVPKAQHLGGLHIFEVRRRNLGHRFVAVLQEVLRCLDLLSQRHEPIADMRGHDAGGDEGPSFAPLSEFLQL